LPPLWKKYKPPGRPVLRFLLAVSLLFPAGIVTGHSTPGNETQPVTGPPFTIMEGKIMGTVSGRAVELPLPGGVFALYHGEDGLYYLRSAGPLEKEGPRYRAGFYKLHSDAGREIGIEAQAGPESFRRLRGREGQCYFLLLSSIPGEAPALYRADSGTGAVSVKNGVLDYYPGDSGIVALEQDESSIHVNFKERTLPLLLRGEGVSIKDIRDGRICFISDGMRTEIVDILSMRSLYVYSENVVYAAPETHNLLIEVVDQKAGDDPERRVFYRVLMNGIESGRTDTGPPDTPRVYRTSVSPDTSHVVALERWELNMARKRYERSNNIYQPGPVKIFMPRNLVLGVYLRYDGKEYRRVVLPVTAP